MSLHAYLLFAAASALLALIPGPDMAYIVTRAVAQGRRAGSVAALGVNAGSYVHLAAAVTGLSALLLASATAFTVVKWIGAAYLCVLGVSVLLARQAFTDVGSSALQGRSLSAVFWQGFLTDALNPKVALFYVALLPQFVEPGSLPVTLQLVLLGITSNVIGIAINLAIVAASATFTQRLRRSRRTALWLQRAMGLLFVGLGVRLAAERA